MSRSRYDVIGRMKIPELSNERLLAIREGVEEPNGAFLATFSCLMLLTFGTSAVAGTASFGTFLKAGSVSSLVAGYVACAVFIRRRAPWLSWSTCFGLLMQVLISVAVLFAITCFGAAHPQPFSWTAAGIYAACVAWSGVSLASGWGLFKNRWWGYFGEALVICAGYAAIVFVSRQMSGSASDDSSNLAKIAYVPYIVLFYGSVASMIRTGFDRWRERGADAATA